MRDGSAALVCGFVLGLILATAPATAGLEQGGSTGETETTGARWAILCDEDGRESGGGGLVETRSGDIVVASRTNPWLQGGRGDVCVLRVAPSGKIRWQWRYGGGSRDEIAEDAPVRQTADEGFLIAGFTESFGSGGRDFWVLRLDRRGKIRWQRAYGGPLEDWGYTMDLTSDGGSVVAGRTWSFGAGRADAWILRLDSMGEIVWQRAYGGSLEEFVLSVRATPDGGFIAAGFTDSFGAGGRDFWVLKLDASGQIEWQRTYGGPASEWATAVEPTRDGGYVVAGVTHEFGDYGITWVLKLTGEGEIEWQRAYGGHFLDMAFDVEQTVDGGYLVAGQTESFGRRLDAFLLKLDRAGRVKWHHTYGDWYDEFAFSARQIGDGGYVVVGGSNSAGTFPGDWDLFVLKLSRAGELGAASGLLADAETRIVRTSYSPSSTQVVPLDTSAVAMRTAGRRWKWRARAEVLFRGAQALPAAPTRLRLRLVSQQRVTLAWDDNSSSEKGFRIERRARPAGTWSEIGTTRRNRTRWSDKAVEPDRRYEYRVRAHGRDGFSPYSNTVDVTIGAGGPVAYRASKVSVDRSDPPSPMGGIGSTRALRRPGS